MTISHFLDAMQRYKNLSVPIYLIKYALDKKLIKELRIFLYLKLCTPGKFKLRDKEVELMANLQIRDKRTLKRLIGSLRANGFIGFDELTGVIFIRSYQRMKASQSLTGKEAARLYVENINMLQDFMNWLTGSLVAKTTRTIRKKKQVSTKNGEETKPRIVLPEIKGKVSHGLAVRYFALKFGLSYGTSQRMLKHAEKAKVITRQRIDVPLDMVLNGVLYLPLGCHLPMLLDQFPNMLGRVRVRQSIPFIRMADQVYSSIELTRRK